jgi:hypothetical protein
VLIGEALPLNETIYRAKIPRKKIPERSVSIIPVCNSLALLMERKRLRIFHFPRILISDQGGLTDTIMGGPFLPILLLCRQKILRLKKSSRTWKKKTIKFRQRDFV